MIKNRISIVVPCFNEGDNIKIVVEKFQEIIEQTKYDLEVIVVDGASTDGTQQQLDNLFKNLDSNHFKLFLKKDRGGYGGDIMHGLAHASGDIMGWTHADMQTDPTDVITAIDLYCEHKNDNILIKGKRKNRRYLEALFTFGMQVFAFIVLKIYLSDINAQPKIFSRNFYQKFMKDNHPRDFSLDLDLLYKAKKNGYKILTIPVFFAKRQYGEAKGGGGGWQSRIKLIKRTAKYILTLKRNS